MKTTNTLRSIAFSAATLAALVGSNGVLAESRNNEAALPNGKSAQSAAGLKNGHDAMNNRRPAQDGELPRHAKAQSGVAGEIDADVVSAREISLTLADGSVVTARVQRQVTDARRGAQTWIGTFDGAPGSSLVLTKSAGTVSGFANVNGQTLEILPSTTGKHVLFAVDSNKLPMSDGVIKFDSSSANVLTTTSGSGVGVSTALEAGSAVVQDLLVVYTAAAASAWGNATLESMVQSAVQSANQAYVNSQVGVTLNLVGLRQVAMSESGSGMQATLNALKSNGEVRSLRDSLAADMVVLVSQDSDWCGYANLTISTVNGVSNTDAYAVAKSSCLSNQALAHEVGHLQGLDHDRASSTGTSAFYPYAYGYRMCTTGGFRDVMAYPCSGATLILQFSNPSVYYNGYATGVSYEANPSNAADAARALNTSATQVAAYRVGSSSGGTTTVPAGPSALAASTVAYNGIKVVWTDNAANESGYKVERSPDGVVFSEVASLGVNAASFSDVGVAASSRYFYRVRAFNSAGASAYSNTINVTTPNVPPPPPAAPTSVAAVNNGNGSAGVSWTVGATTATSFDVRRETWDSRKSVWGSASTAATVPASVRSIADSTGAGTYRYTVRATNAGGSSGYAGPASVNVTSSTTTPTKKTPPGRR